MAALIKELLLDLNTLNIDQKLDLVIAIEQLISAGIIKRNDLVLLNDYLSGYCAEEIAIRQYLSTETVNGILARIMKAIETTSNYTDELFVHSVSNRYSKHQLQRLREFLTRHGTIFDKGMI